jgi:hypothetical protein
MLYLYFIKNGHYTAVIDAGTDAVSLTKTAKRFLQAEYGATETWGYDSGKALVHPNSPHGIGGGHYVDTLITTRGNLHR